MESHKYMKMEKGCPPQESAPPYPGPPLNYEGAGPQPEMYPPPAYHQPGLHPQPAMYPPPAVYPQPAVYSQPGVHSVAPPPAGYQAGVPYAAAAPITTVTHVVVTPMLRDYPGQALCQNCQQTVTTRTTHVAGAMAWTVCAIIAVLGGWLCCCIPFCLDSCQDVEHHCPLCNRIIYVFRRM